MTPEGAPGAPVRPDTSNDGADACAPSSVQCIGRRPQICSAGYLQLAIGGSDGRVSPPVPSGAISTNITGDQVPDHGRSGLRALELSSIVLDGG
jgi:hypothetical protein